MITFGDIGISSQPTRTGRQLLLIDIIRDNNTGETYHWMVYTPILNGEELMNYLNNNATIYENDIIRKESLWNDSPKTITYEDPMMGGTITVDIQKEEIVKPTIPDFDEIAAEQTVATSQLLSMWNEDDYLSKRLSFYETKDTYTDYDNVTLESSKLKKTKQIKKVANDILSNYCAKNMKDVDIPSNDILTLRETRREVLLEQITILNQEVDSLTTIDEVIQYKVGFDVSTILYNTLLQKFYGESRNTYNLNGNQPSTLPENVIELQLTENIKPIYDTSTQKCIGSRVVDTINKEWRLEWTVVDKTPYEIAMESWTYPNFVKKIIAPIQLIMDDIGIKMYGWFQVNNLPIEPKDSSVHLYCNVILPEHQAVIDALQGVIVVQDIPTEN